MKWPIVSVETSAGPQRAIAPYIISASRATDIPAFHARWLKNRLDAGYCKWLNPFNGRTVYVSFERARAFVFWTKNAAPMLPLLPELDRRGLAYYFQFTLNDYEAEGLEPHVPPLAERLATFKRLSQMLGKHRVIWRYDPLLLTDTLAVDDLLAKVERIGRELHRYAEKLVFSFADVAGYAKVKKNLEEAGVRFRDFDESAMHAFAAGLSRLLADWNIAACTCAESVDLARHGIGHNRCIDGELLLRISGNNRDLLDAFGVESNSAADPLGRQLNCRTDLPAALDQDRLKDKGQRKACGCIASKDIGQYNTCPHLCRYCYANASPQVVELNVECISADGESIAAAGQ
jgi:DNA repair photolyase